jgi:hypothetical protein
LRVNNGKLPTNTNTFMILTSLLLTTYCYDGHEGYDGYDGYDSHDSHNGHNGHNGHDGHDGHDGHGVTAIDALTEPVGTLTTIDVNKSTQNNLLDR